MRKMCWSRILNKRYPELLYHQKNTSTVKTRRIYLFLFVRDTEANGCGHFWLDLFDYLRLSIYTRLTSHILLTIYVDVVGSIQNCHAVSVHKTVTHGSSL